MNIPGNLIIDFPLDICKDCKNSNPIVEMSYRIDCFGPHDSYEQYELTCTHLSGCKYAFEKGAKKNG